eukprot:1092071-Pyramimonas_sp.AAC.1
MPMGMPSFSDQRMRIQHCPRGIQPISGTPQPRTRARRALALGICAFSVAYPHGDARVFRSENVFFYIGFSPLDLGVQPRSRCLKLISGTPPPRARAGDWHLRIQRPYPH